MSRRATGSQELTDLGIRIKAMARTADGVRAATECVVDGGWGTYRQFHPTFSFYADHRRCRPLVAIDANGTVIGTAVATSYGHSGWIGHVFVRADHRRRGLGEALTSAAIEPLLASGCERILLAATDAGRPMYERLGFTVESHYHELRGRALAKDTALAPFRPLLRSHHRELSRLDGEIAGDERAGMLANFASFGWGLDRSGSLIGAALPMPWGGVAAWLKPVATGEEIAAMARLIRTIGSICDEVVLCPPDENRAALDVFRELGFEELRVVPRMVLGKPSRWLPEASWSPLSLGLG